LSTDTAAEHTQDKWLVPLIQVRPIWLVLYAGLALRVWLALQFDGIPADLRLYQSWARELAGDGPFHFYETSWKDYLPGYLYVLMGVGFVARALDLNQASWFFALKFPSMIADLASAYVLYLLLAEKSERIRLIAAGIYLALPSVLLVGTLWGQTDSLVALPLLASVYFLGRGKPVATALSFTVAFMVKMLAIAALPLLVIWIVRDYPPRVWVKCGVAGLLLAFAMVWPFFPDHPWDFFDQAYRSTSNFTFSALYTYNFFGIWGWFRWDSQTTFGISWYHWGLVLAGLAEAFVIFACWRARTPGGYALGVALALLASFTFLSRMHERYMFAAFLPFLAACAYYNRAALWAAFVSLAFIHLCSLYVAFYTLGEVKYPTWLFQWRINNRLTWYPSWWGWPGTPVEFAFSLAVIAIVLLLIVYTCFMYYRIRLKGGLRLELAPADKTVPVGIASDS
jgi:Gpi18-like mannosyltransferase